MIFILVFGTSGACVLVGNSLTGELGRKNEDKIGSWWESMIWWLCLQTTSSTFSSPKWVEHKITSIEESNSPLPRKWWYVLWPIGMEVRQKQLMKSLKILSLVLLFAFTFKSTFWYHFFFDQIPPTWHNTLPLPNFRCSFPVYITCNEPIQLNLDNSCNDDIRLNFVFWNSKDFLGKFALIEHLFSIIYIFFVKVQTRDLHVTLKSEKG